MKLEIGKKYKWKHEKVILIYIGKNGNWHVFDNSETGKVWCEVLGSDLHLMEQVNATN